MKKGRAYILSGPSGSGKDTVLAAFLDKNPNIKFSISCVTRQKRGKSCEDKKYCFVTRAEFKNMILNGELLEYNEYLGNFYGTPKKPVLDAINSGEDIIIEVDVNGAANIRKNLDGVKSVFIIPPNLELLKQRLSNRGTESDDQVCSRMEKSLQEISRANEYDYIIINDNLSTAVKEFSEIIEHDGNVEYTYKNRKSIIERMLNKC